MACSWDNPGLLAGRFEKEVKKIYLALDATEQVILAAAAAGADMLITHHPLIFKAVKKVNDGDFIGRRLVALLQADISYYAMHTNFDSAPGCMADMAAEKMGLTDTHVLEPEGEIDGVVYGIGKIGKTAVEHHLQRPNGGRVPALGQERRFPGYLPAFQQTDIRFPVQNFPLYGRQKP